MYLKCCFNIRLKNEKKNMFKSEFPSFDFTRPKMSDNVTYITNCYTPGANLTYLAPLPGQFFMGAKSFIGTPEMQRIFVLKDKLNWTMKKCMVSMATVNAILEHGGVHRKLTISLLLLILDH